jgi:hypothetical protein
MRISYVHINDLCKVKFQGTQLNSVRFIGMHIFLTKINSKKNSTNINHNNVIPLESKKNFV